MRIYHFHAGTRRFGEYGVLYDLIKYPDRDLSGKNRQTTQKSVYGFENPEKSLIRVRL